MFSVLDDITWSMAWAAAVNQVGQWMEMDTGAPMHIHGIITQGRGANSASQWVTQFQVEYRLDIAVGSALTLPETFTMASAKKEHLFSAPVYARYVRIIVLAWNVHISMRAALVVRSCVSCPSNGFSAQGSTSVHDCRCPVGAYNDTTAVKRRAIALVPGRAQLSTLANRNNRAYVSTAQFDSTMGPPAGNGAVTFDRTILQHIDGGSHTFNIATNGGFTAVALVMFTGTASNNERVFLFTGSANIQTFTLKRGSDTQISFEVVQSTSSWCSLSPASVIVQNTWQQIVVIYNANENILELRVDGFRFNRNCPVALTDRVFVSTSIGSGLTGTIAGLYVVDALFTDNNITDIITDMETGKDTLVEGVMSVLSTHLKQLWGMRCA